MLSYRISDCDLGAVLIASRGRGICILQLGDDPKEMESNFLVQNPQAEKTDSVISDDIVEKIVTYLDDPNEEMKIELDIQGTDFQKKVWEALRKIPAGKPETYTSLANKLGSLDAVRAVATACGANPIAVLIPCHRVIRSDGGMGGYKWGLWRKQALLKKEGNLLI
jgi:AraC family transcriptional regulator of adaptative response/methylated-DNA-[protein]-cysteine methyltransferase